MYVRGYAHGYKQQKKIVGAWEWPWREDKVECEGEYEGEAIGGRQDILAVADSTTVSPRSTLQRRQPRRGLPGFPGASPPQERGRLRHQLRLQPVQVTPAAIHFFVTQ